MDAWGNGFVYGLKLVATCAAWRAVATLSGVGKAFGVPTICTEIYRDAHLTYMEFLANFNGPGQGAPRSLERAARFLLP